MTILETYKSIKEQTFSSWEWVVTEDCSSDDTYNVLCEIAKEDKKVVVLRNSKNSGTAISRNRSIEAARGRYVAFLDADDLWKPNKLDVQIEYMQKNNIAFSYSNYDVLPIKGKAKTFNPKKEKINYKGLLKRNDIGCLTVIYDTTILGKRYMPLDAQKREDYAAWLDITKDGYVAFKLNESLAIYRLSAVTLTSNKKKMIKYHYRVYRNHEGFGRLKSLYYLIIFMLNKKFTKYN